jgi:hypothetical protein
MSAAEIIEQIKTLPDNELSEVAEFVRSLTAENGDAAKTRYVDPEKARVIASRVFEENAELFRKLAE